MSIIKVSLLRYCFRTICGLMLIVCTAQLAFGQAARSPFSSFGIGDYYGTAPAHSQGMAGVGISNPQYLFLNNLNPALLVYNGIGGITTFQAGIVGEQRTIKDEVNRDKSTGGNLNYLLFGFPIKSGKWVTSVGLLPYSSVRYNFSYYEQVGGTGSDVAFFTQKGSGGINQVAWSHGIALHKNLSLGARASYLFSAVERTFSNTVTLDGQTSYFTPSETQRFNYKGFAFTGAVSLHLDSLFNDEYKFNFGAVYDFKADINTDYMLILERYNAAATVVSTDTLSTAGLSTTIPSALSTGISFGRGNQWIVAVDARITDYNKLTFPEVQTVSTTNGWRLAAGFELTPNPGSLSNYFKIVTYRTGVSMEKLPYLANGNSIRDLGANFGLSLPVSAGCYIDLAGRWGTRGSIENNTVEEKYTRLYFGVTFNDRWFRKRRFD